MAMVERKVAIGCPGLNLSGEEISSYYQKLKEIDPIITDGTIETVQDFVTYENIGVRLLAMASNPNSPHYRKTSAYQPLVHALNVAAFDVAKSAGKLDGAKIGFVLGQDVGQFGAAVIAGGLSRKDAARLVAIRGNLTRQAGGVIHTLFMSNYMVKFDQELNRLRVMDHIKNPQPIKVNNPETPLVLDGFTVRESPRMTHFMVLNMVEQDKYNLCCEKIKKEKIQKFLISGPGSVLAAANAANGFEKSKTVNIVDLF